MTVSLFTFVDLYSKGLTTLDSLLAKGAAYHRLYNEQFSAPATSVNRA